MTIEQAITVLRGMEKYLCSGNPIWKTELIKESVNMACEALVQADTPQTDYSCNTCANKGDHGGECRNCVTDSETIRWKTPSNYEPQTESYYTDATHFGKAKGNSITTNTADTPQTDCEVSR